MKKQSKNSLPINQIIQGDCLDVLKTLPENSVDAVITDPPYELGFMGKSWDNTGIANNHLMWAECLRVLKPGGHLLAFGGTRTYHRMAVAIEDAGFEVRDMIEWVYGCLSEDTEILTESGYKPLHKLTQYDRIGVYDITNNIYKWERPQRYSIYKVHQDTAYRIKSDYTDQIVSRNHRCLVEREGKLVFIQAEELNEVEYMPTLSEDFYSLQKNSNRKLLLKELLWKGKRLAQKVFSKWTGNKKSEERIEVRKEPSLERWSNLLEETRKLQADKICEVSEGVFTDGEKRWICNGTSFDSGSILGDMFRENPSSASYQSQSTRQQTGKFDVISIKQGSQITRRARITKIEYSGIIFCPTVSTGAFIARRNGQVFITGNSGFPKSLNIGKAVDKIRGNEREEYNPGGRYNYSFQEGNSQFVSETATSSGKRISILPTKGTSEWEGWGTALKPAHEPICMARKPLDRWWKIKDDGKKVMGRVMTVAENCLKWGTGGINIDESRVGTEKIPLSNHNKTIGGNGKYQGGVAMKTGGGTGRFPANLIHDNSEEVRECFPENKSSNAIRKNNGKLDDKTFGKYNAVDSFGFNDSGNASRFFKSIIYQAKASKSDRNKGLDCYLTVKYNGSIINNNKTLCKEENMVAVQLLQKVISEQELVSFNIDESGVNIMAQCHKDSLSTILTEINRIIGLKIYNSLMHSLTNESTQVVNSEREVGGSLAENVADLKRWILTTTKGNQVLALGASRVVCQMLQLISVEENWKEKTNTHSTVKPVALMEYLINMVTREGQIVLDPFIGSGTTAIACVKNRRQYIGIELEPDYVKIAEARVKNIPQKLL